MKKLAIACAAVAVCTGGWLLMKGVSPDAEVADRATSKRAAAARSPASAPGAAAQSDGAKARTFKNRPTLPQPKRLRGEAPPPESRMPGKRQVTLSLKEQGVLISGMRTSLLQGSIDDMDLPPKQAAALRQNVATYEKNVRRLQDQIIDGTLPADEFAKKLRDEITRHDEANKKVLGNDRAADLGQLRMQRGKDALKIMRTFD